MEIWGVEGATPTAPPVDLEDHRPDAHLIHGPAADGGPSQADVDALFEQLGKMADTPKTAKADQAGADASSQKASQSQIDAMFNAAQ
jgi:hypothetical protein